MSEPTDAAIKWDDCDRCGESLNKYGTPHFAEFTAKEYAEFLDVGFCSWDHLAEWTAKGRPQFDTWGSDIPVSRWSVAGGWLMDAAVYAGILAWTGLAVFGLLTLIWR